MPIALGGQGARRRVGGPGVLAIPGKRFGAGRPNVVGYWWLSSRPFRSVPFSTANTTIFGVTKDSTGTALGSCRVELFQTGGDIPTRVTTSDALGNYKFDNPGSGPFYIVAYKTGVPDVAGTTVNTLTAA